MPAHTIDVSPDEAARLVEDGAVLIDIREVHEFQRAFIPGSHNVALSGFEGATLPTASGQDVVYLCASGGRTAMHAHRLAAKAGSAKAYVMRGGIGAWQRSGLPVEGHSGGPGLFGRLFG